MAATMPARHMLMPIPAHQSYFGMSRRRMDLTLFTGLKIGVGDSTMSYSQASHAASGAQEMAGKGIVNQTTLLPPARASGAFPYTPFVSLSLLTDKEPC